jgi:hypothetical protein
VGGDLLKRLLQRRRLGGPQREFEAFFYFYVSINNALIAEAHVELSYPYLFFLHCYISLLSTGKE